MFQSMPLFKGTHEMARHAGQRQALIARNMANADTPGYVPRDLPKFSIDRASLGADATAMRATRAAHVDFGHTGSVVRPISRPSGFGPNGNAVSLEEELLNSVEARRQHDRALAIYRAGLSILRTSLGKV